MGSQSPLKDHLPPQPARTKLLPFILYLLLPLALFYFFYFDHFSFSLPSTPPYSHDPISVSAASSSPAQEEKSSSAEIPLCDYTKGKWVKDKRGPMYNGTSCGAIKEGQNCMGHGRPDTGYLYWRWRPDRCRIPRFRPSSFLKLLENKHLAFVGDSMARNQLESLLCMLASVSTPSLVYRNGDDNKFRKWHFPSHNVTVSLYWSPFLVKGYEKSADFSCNKLYLDRVDEKWGNDMDSMDTIVLSVGHWYLHPAVFFQGGSVFGCHFCATDQNHTEIGFYDVFGKAIRTTLKAIIDSRTGSRVRKAIDVVLTTFSPSHFEGQWDKFGACSKTRPYEEGEKEVEGMDGEMRKVELDEVERAKGYVKGVTKNLRLEALDVTKLAMMRPDGHPGPYMHPFPFADGVTERVQNDCVHWCLPGPVDTWNEILLEVINRWNGGF